MYDAQFRFICTVQADGFGNSKDLVSQAHVGQWIAEQRCYKSSKRIVAANSHHEYLSTGELIADQARWQQPIGDAPMVPAGTRGARNAVESRQEQDRYEAESCRAPRVDLLAGVADAWPPPGIIPQRSSSRLGV